MLSNGQTISDKQVIISGFASRYRVKEHLGSGGMGDVYLAEDTELHRLVAIKTVREALCEDEEIRKRIARECLLHAKVGPHPHIVTLFDKLEEEGRIQLVMEYVDGETLHVHLANLAEEGAVMPVQEATRIVMQCLDALSRIHANGIVHRDIKPANVILSRDDEGGLCAKLMDFGIARSETGDTSMQITGSGRSGPGTPLYMAPEQIDSETYGEIAHVTDVYAMGVLLYQLVSGEPPFNGTLTEILNGHLNQPVPPLEIDSLAEKAEAFGEVIERALAKLPADRFPSARAFHDELAGLSLSQGAVRADGDVTQRIVYPTPTVVARDARAMTTKGGTRLPDETGHETVRSRSTPVWAAVAAVLSIFVFGVMGFALRGNGGAGPRAPEPLPHSLEPDQSVLTPSVFPAVVEPLAEPAPDEAMTPDETAGGALLLVEPDAPEDGISSEEGSAMAAFLKGRDDPQRFEEPPQGSVLPVPLGSTPALREAAVAEGQTYVVQSGDSISKISGQFGIGMDDLARWNLLEKPDSIKAGQTLYLYERPGLPEIEIQKKPPVSSEPAGGEGKPAGDLKKSERPAADEGARPRRILKGLLRRIRR